MKRPRVDEPDASESQLAPSPPPAPGSSDGSGVDSGSMTSEESDASESQLVPPPPPAPDSSDGWGVDLGSMTAEEEGRWKNPLGLVLDMRRRDDQEDRLGSQEDWA